MPTCCVPGCRTRYGNSKGDHLFTPPSDKTELDKWARAIPRKDKEISKKSRVCASHFSEDMIIKIDTFVVNGQRVEIPGIKWKLKPGSVPHIFPNLPKYFTKDRVTRKPPCIRHKTESKLKERKIVQFLKMLTMLRGSLQLMQLKCPRLMKS